MVKNTLDEDIRSGDITTRNIFSIEQNELNASSKLSNSPTPTRAINAAPIAVVSKFLYWAFKLFTNVLRFESENNFTLFWASSFKFWIDKSLL